MHPFGRRRPFVAGAAVLSVVLVTGASILLAAAYGFDVQALAHPGSIVDKGEDVARLLRWGALVDMASYLPMAVVMVYFHHRLRARNPELVSLLTAGGLAYVLIGSISGALLGAAGPPLIAGYASASAAGQEATRVALEALGNASLVGLWGTLELICIGFWFLGNRLAAAKRVAQIRGVVDRRGRGHAGHERPDRPHRSNAGGGQRTDRPRDRCPPRVVLRVDLLAGRPPMAQCLTRHGPIGTRCYA
jgi:hypothetical protein